MPRFMGLHAILTRTRHRFAVPVLAAALALGAPAAAFAQILALDFTGGTPGNSFLTLGWSFSVASPINVTSLGFWDEGNNGLLFSHQVGLWDNAGTLLASTTVPAGTSATAVVSGSGSGSFRFVTLSSALPLNAGNYVVGGKCENGDYVRVNASSISTVSPITYGERRSNNQSSFSFPTSGGVGNAFFGPDFQFTQVVAVPEPGTLALLGAGMHAVLPLMCPQLRRRRRARHGRVRA